MENKDQVQVVRHVRGNLVSFDMHGNTRSEVSNLHGITLVYDIDYEKGTVLVSWAVCHNENFDKGVGATIARSNNQRLQFSLEDVKKFGGLNHALVANLQENKFIKTAVYFFDVYTPLRKGLNKLNMLVDKDVK